VYYTNADVKVHRITWLIEESEMNNYLIHVPLTYIDNIANARLKLINKRYNIDIKNEATLLQVLIEQHNRHWNNIGKPLVLEMADIKNEPFVAEYHNLAVDLIDNDISILFDEYPQLLSTIAANYNYNSVSNDVLRYHIDNITIDANNYDIKESAVVASGNYSVIITDELNNTTNIDDNYTSADITNGYATLPVSDSPYDISGNAKVYLVNATRFMNDDGSLRQGIPGLTEQVITVDIPGVESNGFPGSIHEGRSTYGITNDATGDTSMQEIIEPIDGQDIHIDMNAVIDGNPDTWYATELCNVTPEMLEIDQYGYNFAKPNDDIRWAIGSRDGETLKLALLLHLEEEVPANKVVVSVHDTKPASASIDVVMVRSDGGDWKVAHRNEIVPTNDTDQYNDTNTAEPAGNSNDDINRQVMQALPVSVQAMILNNPAALQLPQIKDVVSSVCEQYGITYEEFSIPADYSVTYFGFTYTSGGGYTPSTYGVSNNSDVTTQQGYYDIDTHDSSVSAEYIDIDTTRNVTPDNTKLSITFDNSNRIKELIVLLKQTRSYNCKIIHRYYEHIYVTRTTETTSESGGVFKHHTTQHTEVTMQKTVERVEGQNLPASAMFAGIGGNSEAHQGAGATIGNVLTTVGSTMAMAGIGGVAAPIVAGLGMIIGGLWGGTETTSTNTDVIQDEYITGLELMDGWKYIIGVNDISLYGTSYKQSADIVSNNYVLPFEIRSVSLNVSQVVPRSYPAGEWIKHYISIDNGRSWNRIIPSNYPVSSSEYPRVYLINAEDTATSVLTQLITTADPVHTVRYKCVLTRPAEYPHNLYSPILYSYSLHVSGEIGVTE